MSDDTLRMTITRANDMRSWAQGKGGLFEVFDAIHNNYVAEITDSDPTEPAIIRKVEQMVTELTHFSRG